MRGGGAVFKDLHEARSAFALGPVKFRCCICDRVHWSSEPAVRRCLQTMRCLYPVSVHHATRTYKIVRAIEAAWPALNAWYSWCTAGFFGHEKREWQMLRSLWTKFRGGFRWIDCPLLCDPVILAIPRELFLRHYNAWWDAAVAELENWGSRFDREREEDFRRLEGLVERLCVPRSFPSIVEIHRDPDDPGVVREIRCVDGSETKTYEGIAVARSVPFLREDVLIALGEWVGMPKDVLLRFIAGLSADCWYRETLLAVETEPDRFRIVVSVTAEPALKMDFPLPSASFLVGWSVGQRSPEVLGVVPAARVCSVADALRSARPLRL